MLENIKEKGPNWFITEDDKIFIRDSYDNELFELNKKRFSGTDWCKIKRKLENKEKIITFKNKENRMKFRTGKGNCSMCGKEVTKRDQMCRGYECGCHDKWYIEHNSSNKMKRKASELGKKYSHLLVNESKTEKGRNRRSKIMFDLHQNNEKFKNHIKDQAYRNLNLINNILAKDPKWLEEHPDFGLRGDNIHRWNQPYTIDKITNLIETSEFTDRKDVQDLLKRIKNLKNYNEEMPELIFNKAKELGIPTSWREEFYSKTLDIISFNSVEELISNFDSLEGIPGVWAIKGSDEIIYDVAQTKDIGNEMYEYLRRLNFNKGLTDEKINSENSRYLYNRKKFRDIMNDTDEVNFILVARDIDSKEKRELIEMQYAHDAKAKYWSPAPCQIKE